MIIDCHTCPVRGRHCGDCVVPVVARTWLSGPELTGPGGRGAPVLPGGPASGGPTGTEEAEELQDAEWDAVEVFVRAGLLNTLDAADAQVSVEARAWSRTG